MLDTTQWIVLGTVLALIIIIAAAVVASRRSQHRHNELKHQFGPEYDRAVAQHGNVTRAEQELIQREKRVHSQRLHPLTEADRALFSKDWENVQTRFVDDPAGAVQVADELIKSMMLARGYSRESVERRDVDLSVEHPSVVEHYRAARELAQETREGRASTEDLRQAVVHYRALFSDLLQPDPPTKQPNLQEARA